MNANKSYISKAEGISLIEKAYHIQYTIHDQRHNGPKGLGDLTKVIAFKSCKFVKI